MVETKASTAKPCIEDWTQAPWPKLERHVYRLQKRIYRAQQSGNLKVVHSLQRLLLKSQAARMLATRRVTQDNQGRKTAGIDGVRAVSPTIRLRFVDLLRTPERITAQPVRRVLIPKAGKPNARRALGIPVLLDRAHQALVKLALEPQWEARFEPDSYGFRPGRSCQDAVEAIFKQTAFTPKYVLDADIEGCFDAISHSALLAKLDTIPAIRRAVRAWLKAGVMTKGMMTPTTRGVPQGGVISPLLMNVALDGLQTAVETAYRKRMPGTKRKPGAAYGPRLIRYADDLVVLCRDLDGITVAREVVEQWLDTMGLRLSPTKTRTTHTLDAHEGHVGFDFLGFTFRQRRTGRCHAARFKGKVSTGLVVQVTPSKDAVKRHLRNLQATVRRMRTSSQEALIRALNPQIRGWSQYYRHVASSATFNRCNQAVYALLRRWSRRRHPKKGAKWIVRRYWHHYKGTRWSFQVSEMLRLQKHTDTKHTPFVKVQGSASPYDGNLLYWSKRLKARWVGTSRMARLLRRQQGGCGWCGLTFRDGDHLEIHHVIRQADGGTSEDGNLQVLHVHCHDQLTARQRASRKGYHRQ
ncbi:MAG: group II intron reverse transcriptase/maturase [Chloroflexota bacterium]|nr:group II intron reverse transcriptase/maturase [Chloroflexota bacterium]